MATEYVLYGSADLSSAEIRSFMVRVVGGEVLGNYVRRGALDVTAYRDDPEDPSPVAEMLGFTHRVTATYRFSNRATSEARDEAARVMIRSALTFFAHYSADGVLLFNDSQIIMQRLNGPVVIDHDWEDWTDVPGMRQLIAGIDTRRLPQPLL